jgi:methionyl-tRNA formyltransferase
MRLGYMGSPAISARLLHALLESPHEIAFVVSNPDSSRGRSSRLQPTEVSALALDRGLPLFRPTSLKNGAITPDLAAFNVDLIVVFAYGRLLPADVFEMPPAGTINLHASILPLLRGASPIQSAVLEGFSETGWSIQFIAAGMDTGDVLSEVRVPVDPDESAGELTERLVPAGLQLMLETLERIARTLKEGGDVRRLAATQDQERATHCRKITTAMATIDWSRPAQEIHNTVRAFNPKPIARTAFVEDGAALKIHRTRMISPETLRELTDLTSGNAIPPAELLSLAPGNLRAVRFPQGPGLLVTTGDGCLEIRELQPENRKKLTAKDFLNGYRKAGPVLLGSTTT